MKGWLDNFGKAENANDSKVSLSEGFVGMGNDTTGRNYSPAWGGQFQTGGSIPGSVGFTYARTVGSAPSEGKYAKKTLPSAQDGIKTVSTSSPEYKQLYKNRQIGRWLDENNFDSQVPLDEVNVSGSRMSPFEAYNYDAQQEAIKMRSQRASERELAGNNPLNQRLGVFKPSNWTRENWSQVGKGLESQFRFSDAPNAFDDYINPVNMLGTMASGLGQAPQQAQESDSNVPYLTSVGIPAAMGLLGGIGAKSTGQFVNNLTNPLAGIKLDPLKNYSPKFDTDALINKIQNRIQPSSPILRGYEDDQYISNISRNFLADNQLPPPPSELYIPNTEFRRLTAAEKREGVKDFLNYRNVNSSGIENINDADERIIDWLNTNRFELPDIDFGERLGGILDRYNIQRGDGRSFEQLARSLPSDTKPQFLQDVVSTLPRKITDDELLQARIRYQDTQKATGSNKPIIKNKSGLTKEEVIQRSKDKDKVSKMTEEDFQNTVLKPSGELVDYRPGIEVDQMTYNPSSGRTILKDQLPMSEKEYADAFNERLDLLNDIIAKRNKSGVDYKVKELSPSGYLKFETPSGQKTINPSVGEEIDIPSGESVWSVRLNPGQWQGEVQDIANSDYYKSIPGLEMSNTTGTVFADRNPRKGTGAYESINEYLKQMDLGRVKPGFNSQTTFSRSAWENFIRTGRGVGYYANPNLVYGTMKTALPVGIGAAAIAEKEYKQGGIIKDNRGQWDHPGEVTEIDSNYITMGPDPVTGKEIDYNVLAVSNTGDTKLMKPGKNYKFKGEKVTEYPVGKNGINQLDAQPKKKLDDLLNFTNYNKPASSGWLDKFN